jgi:hypothetical protein
MLPWAGHHQFLHKISTPELALTSTGCFSWNPQKVGRDASTSDYIDTVMHEQFRCGCHVIELIPLSNPIPSPPLNEIPTSPDIQMLKNYTKADSVGGSPDIFVFKINRDVFNLGCIGNEHTSRY